MTAHESRSLTEREGKVLATLLAATGSELGHRAAELTTLKVSGSCGCGCPTIYFDQGAQSVGIEVAAEATVDGTDDAVVLYVNAQGEIDSLEYIWVGTSPPSAFPLPSSLRPLGR